MKYVITGLVLIIITLIVLGMTKQSGNNTHCDIEWTPNGKSEPMNHCRKPDAGIQQ